MTDKPTYEELEKRVKKLEQEARMFKKEELQQNEEMFRLITDTALDSIFCKDLNRKYTYVNLSMVQLLDCNEDDLIGKTPEEIFDKEAADIILEVDERTLIGEKVSEIRSLTIAGKPYAFHTIQVPLYDSGGNITGISGIVRDITEFDQKEKSLIESEKRYELISENISNVIWTMDMNFQNTYVSPSVIHQRGYTAEEARSQTLSERMSPESLEKALNIFNEKLKLIEASDPEGWKPIKLEIEQPCKDGSMIWTTNTVKLLPGPDKKPASILGTTHDITERKQMEEALKKSEEHYKNLYDNALVGMWRSRISDGKLLKTNNVHAKMSGFSSPDEALNSNFKLSSLYPKETRKKLIKLLKKNGSVSNFEAHLTYPDGKEQDISISAKIFPQKDYMEGVVIDITELRKAQVEKMEALTLAAQNEKHALVGQIAGKMAHDFNNILGIVMGNAELALIDCQDDQIKKTLELIYEQTFRGKNLTKNLVAFARDQELKQEFFELEEKMALVINLMKRDLEGIQVVKEYSHDVPEILADPGMIEHAIVNLLQNSIHATSLIKEPKIIIRAYHKEERIFIEVEDNGCGIPKEFLGDIFDPSFTLKGSKDKNGMYKPNIKGTGYGMSNVKKYIEQHRGNISLYSEFQKGTKVTIDLPIIKKQLTKKEIINIKKEPFIFGKYILVVEDEQAISDIQYRILTNEPCCHNVDIAINGKAAIDLLNRNEYDLISLDYILPGEFNGMDVYHHVREKNKIIPILFISGNIEFLESIKELKQNDQYIDHLSKPCKNIDYILGINKLFESVSI